MRSAAWRAVLVLAYGAALTACGDDDASDRSDAGMFDGAVPDGAAADAAGAGGGPSDAAAADGGGELMSPELLANLEALGVPTEARPLETADGDPIPDSYSPFGAVLELGRRNEVFLLGPTVTDDPANLLDDGLVDPAYPLLGSWAQADWPWAIETSDAETTPGTIRAAVAGDFLTTGVEEIAIAYVDEVAHQLRVQVLHEGPAGFEAADYLLVDSVDAAGRVNDVAVASGDLDGDGYDDLAVGYVIVTETETSPGVVSVRSDATVLWATVAADAVDVARAPAVVIPGRLSQSHMTLALAAGRLDYDDAEELAIVANEVAAASQGSNAVARARARYFLLDDSQQGFAELRSGDVIGEDDNGEVRLASVAGVALGDIDQDPFDEIVLAGLTMEDSYLPIGGACEAISYLLAGIDDGVAGFRALGATQVASEVDVCSDDGARTALMHHVHVNVLNVDGIGPEEIQANEVLLTFDASASPLFAVQHRIPSAEYFATCAAAPYDRGSSAVATGDFVGNGRDQVLHHCSSEMSADLWGLAPDATAVTRIDAIALIDSGPYPLVVGANVAHDGSRNGAGDVIEGSQVLELMPSDAADSYVITEPIVIAALAAAPCAEGIGQNTDECVTSFGKTDSVSLDTESSYRLSASAGFGLKVTGGVVAQSEADFVTKFGVALTKAESHQTSISKTVTYTTGPMEDTIVFAAVPYRRFLYRVRSAFDESMIGAIVSVYLPHSPMVQQAERGFYNEHVLEAADRVGGVLFPHVVGDLDTYMTQDQAMAMLGAHCDGRIFPPCRALQAGPQAVGQGEGSTELGIEVADEDGIAGELELSASIEVETTIATVKVTLEFAAERAWSIGTTVGEAVSFTGSVGAIGPENFAANRYSWGMFAYAYGDRGAFQVVNYWVER